MTRFCLIFLMTFSLLGQESSINSVEEFRIHILAHKERLRKLGQALLAAFPKEYEAVDPKLLDEFLSLHDDAKLRKENIETLFRYFGKNKNSLTKKENKEFNRVISALNQSDKKLTRSYLFRRGLINEYGHVSEVARKLLAIEKMVDGVDRGMDPMAREEFSKNMRKHSKRIKRSNPHLRPQAKFLEDHYEKVTRGSTYPSFLSRGLDFRACFINSLSVDF